MWQPDAEAVKTAWRSTRTQKGLLRTLALLRNLARITGHGLPSAVMLIPVPPPPPDEPDIEEELVKNAGPMVQRPSTTRRKRSAT
jgi:hypothetical protein